MRTECFFAVFGGFAVDAYLNKFTRPHDDVDLICWRNDIKKIRLVLKELGHKTQLHKHHLEKKLVYKMNTLDNIFTFQIADPVDSETFEISFWPYTHLRFPLKYLDVRRKKLSDISFPVVARQMLVDLKKRQVLLYEKIKRVDTDKFEKQKDKYEKSIYDIKSLSVDR